MSRDGVHDLLLPLSYLYAGVSGARNHFYDRGWLSVEDCGRPVISVGNITAGGTGKTPFVAWLATELKSHKHRPVIISRGYRAAMENQVSQVKLTDSLAQAAGTWGDEPVMLAERLRDVPVYVGRDKLSVARQAVRETKCDVVIADDAFQHRRLRRALDIVLLDASEPEWHLRPLPAGRLRESARGLERADVIVVTKSNLAKPGARDRLQSWCRSLGVKQKAVWLEFESHLQGFWNLSPFVQPEARDFSSPQAFGEERVFLVSGLAKPRGFEELIRKETRLEILGHEVFPDHHSYSASDIQEIEQKAQTLGASRVVITEKDAVKFPRLKAFALPIWVSQMETRPLSPLDEFHERLARSLR